jgi:hypothetical protein
MAKKIAIVEDHDASGNLAPTGWVYYSDTHKEVIKQARVVVYWDSITGTRDGDIWLEITNDQDDVEKIMPYDADGNIELVDTATNVTDCLAFNISAPFIGMRLKYTANNITGGNISAYALLVD